MDPKDFCYWLQGFFELGGGKDGLTAQQVAQVKAHLALVFHHSIDPAYPGDPQELQDIHDGVTAPNQHLKPKPHRPGEMLVRC